MKRVRVERTLAEQKRLADVIDAWLKKRREADRDVEGLFGQKGAYLGFQKTRLATLESVFNGALKEVKEKLTPKDDAISRRDRPRQTAGRGLRAVPRL